MKKTILGLTILMAAMAPGIASAANHYVGGSIGHTSADVSGPAAQYVTDDTDTGFKLFAGYEFTENLAVEASYADLGAVTFGQEGDVDVDSLGLAVVGKYPVAQDVNLFGKVGLQSWDVSGAGESEDGIDPMYGLGATYDLNEQVQFRAEYERYILDKGFVDADTDMFSVGVAYNF